MARGKLSAGAGLLLWIAATCLCGCESAQQKMVDEQAAADVANAEAEAQSVAANSLGKESEVLAHGDLARNGSEQVLVANRFRPAGVPGDGGSGNGNSAPIFVMRAALLEKNNGRWTELLRCDEHLKNANGYLGGFSKARVSGWRLQFTQDPNAGIEMKFTPADDVAPVSAEAGTTAGPQYQTLDVRWNKSTKRYQSFDQSHERYLTEIPTLETPESSLR
jgi:hypothetical protein